VTIICVLHSLLLTLSVKYTSITFLLTVLEGWLVKISNLQSAHEIRIRIKSNIKFPQLLSISAPVFSKWVTGQNQYAFTKGCDIHRSKWLFRPKEKKELRQNALTHAEDIEAEAMVDGLVDQLVRHAVEANMTREWDGTCTLSLIQDQMKANHK